MASKFDTFEPDIWLCELSKEQVDFISREIMQWDIDCSIKFMCKEQALVELKKPIYVIQKSNTYTLRRINDVCIPAVPFVMTSDYGLTNHIYLLGRGETMDYNARIWTFQRNSLFQRAKPIDIMLHRLAHQDKHE